MMKTNSFLSPLLCLSSLGTASALDLDEQRLAALHDVVQARAQLADQTRHKRAEFVCFFTSYALRYLNEEQKLYDASGGMYDYAKLWKKAHEIAAEMRASGEVPEDYLTFWGHFIEVFERLGPEADVLTQKDCKLFFEIQRKMFAILQQEYACPELDFMVEFYDVISSDPDCERNRAKRAIRELHMKGEPVPKELQKRCRRLQLQNLYELHALASERVKRPFTPPVEGATTELSEEQQAFVDRIYPQRLQYELDYLLLLQAIKGEVEQYQTVPHAQLERRKQYFFCTETIPASWRAYWQAETQLLLWHAGDENEQSRKRALQKLRRQHPLAVKLDDILSLYAQSLITSEMQYVLDRLTSISAKGQRAQAHELLISYHRLHMAAYEMVRNK